MAAVILNERLVEIFFFPMIMNRLDPGPVVLPTSSWISIKCLYSVTIQSESRSNNLKHQRVFLVASWLGGQVFIS